MATSKTVYYFDDYTPNTETVDIIADKSSVKFELLDGATTARLENDFSFIDFQNGLAIVERKGKYNFTVGNLAANALRTARATLTY